MSSFEPDHFNPPATRGNLKCVRNRAGGARHCRRSAPVPGRSKAGRMGRQELSNHNPAADVAVPGTGTLRPRFALCAGVSRGYFTAMSRKTNSDAPRRFGVILGLLLLLGAALLLVAQITFDRHDLAFLKEPHNVRANNWIGLFGAYLAYDSFFVFGLAAYVLPILIAVFGFGHLTRFLTGFRERRLWCGLWAVLFIFSLAGLFYQLDAPLQKAWENTGLPTPAVCWRRSPGTTVSGCSATWGPRSFTSRSF